AGRGGDHADPRQPPVRRHRAGHPRQGAGARRGPRVRQGKRARRRPQDLTMARDPNDLQWALQRRLEDVFSKLGEKYGDLTGRVEMRIRPDVSFDEVGGMPAATKTML